ncbi:MAG: hypothetical protein RMX96_22105 [Nostoc sp. ChiSLP02]|nr:hypothetical protein [Nostoc sp. DedSLP05]MDZ8099096.1 hypothetical protein [Nostoc sp. DedSLP01]MDZ8187530.1 hypothetical protein [Nostoc sp. ChiSLP02]
MESYYIGSVFPAQDSVFTRQRWLINTGKSFRQFLWGSYDFDGYNARLQKTGTKTPIKADCLTTALAHRTRKFES